MPGTRRIPRNATGGAATAPLDARRCIGYAACPDPVRPDGRIPDPVQISMDNERDTPAPPVEVAAFQARAATMGRGAVVIAASPGRTGKQRRFLRALGHALKPVATVGHQGPTLGLLAAIEAQLEAHELIKIRVLESSPCVPEAVALWLHDAAAADIAQILGRVMLVYRRRAKDPALKLPG